MNYDRYLKERLKDPKFKGLVKKHDERFKVAREIIKARFEKGWSQRELAKKAKTTQAVISRIENISVDSRVKLIQKIARAMGKQVVISFVFPA